MRASACWIGIVVGACALFAPTAVRAQDEEVVEEAVDEEDGDDEFTTTWIGLKAGIWYRPRINMDAQVSGRGFTGGLANVIGTELDIERDLGVRENPYSETAVDFDAEAVIEFSPFIETRWVSVYGWFVTPFEYRGDTVLGRQLSFGGATFTASTRVESKFRQFFMGTDVAINVFNNRWFRISPLAGARAIAIDWEIESRPFGGQTVLSGDTSSIDSPLQLGEYEVLPHPELGLILAVGYRDYLDVRLTVAGSYVSYLDLEGSTYRFELAATAYPIPWIGIELGVRYLEYDISSRQEQGREGSFDLDLEFAGLTAAIIVRL